MATRLEERSSSPAEAAPARPGRHRWVRASVVVATGALVAVVLGFLVSDHLSEDAHFDRLHARLATTRGQASDVAADLAQLRHAITDIDTQVTNDSAALSQDTNDLKAAYAALVLTQLDVSQQSSHISALHNCLGGVRQALNALAINDHASAVSSLDAVASSCAAASGG